MAEYFRVNGLDSTFDAAATFSRSGTATYFDNTGTLQTAADGVARGNAYYYNSGWVKGGLRFESQAATQLLHGTDSFATQTETVTAQAYTLQFRGTGSIALTGAHTATLNGTGANDLVSLTFTPSAGTLTLTPSGTVEYPQLEVGSIPTSYIPNTAGSGTVTRAAETLSIAAADLPYSATAMSISMKGLMTYADENSTIQAVFYNWSLSSNDNIQAILATNSTRVGEFRVSQDSTTDGANALAAQVFNPGVNVPFNISSRHLSSEFQLAYGGTTSSIDSDPTVLPDLSATDMELGSNGFNGFISEFRMWGTDIGDSGIEEVTTS